MTTYARLVSKVALDCQVAESLADLATRFHPDWLAKNPFVQVPDGTIHGAADNGNGTFTNPTVMVFAPSPKTLPWTDLSAYLIGLLGGAVTGRTALGAIIKACQASAAGADNYFAAYLQAGGVFAKADFMAVLGDVSTGIVSAGQKTLVSNNWPQG